MLLPVESKFSLTTSNNIMEERLRSLVCHHLDSYLIDCAKFLCERLVAEFPCEANLFLLGTCHSRQGNSGKKVAHSLLQGTKSEQCRYLLAHCSYSIGNLAEAENILLEETEVFEKGLNECKDILVKKPFPVPNGAAGLHLLGKICQDQNRRDQASEYFRLSLLIEPLLWSSFEELSNLGQSVDASMYFGKLPDVPAHTHQFSTLPLPGMKSDIESETYPKLNTKRCIRKNVKCEGQATTNNFIATRKKVESPWGNKKSIFEDKDMAISPICRISPSNASWAHSSMMLSDGSIGLLTPLSTIRNHHLPRDANQNAPIDSLQQSAMQLGSRLIPYRSSSTCIPKCTPSPSISRVLFNSGVLERVKIFEEADTGLTPIESNSPTASDTIDIDMIESDKEISRISKSNISTRNRGGTDRPLTRSAVGRLATENPVENDPTKGKSSRFDKKTSKLTRKPALNVSVLHSTRSTREGISSNENPQAPSNTKAKNVTVNKVKKTREEARKTPAIPYSEPIQPEDNPIFVEVSLQPLAELFCLLSTAYQHLSFYRCTEAIKTLHKLPEHHFNTGWVQNQIGRAYYHMGDYQGAIQAFKFMIEFEPHRLDGLELFSSCLWHLDKQVDLCYLAQRTLDFDRMNPITWCVAGNCFSKQKEHNQALNLFQRAVQLSPRMAYAHALCGHEFVLMDDFEKAIASFRTAISISEQNYNGWFGLGEIYERQERFPLAEIHFRRGLRVNPYCIPLRCHLSAVLCYSKQYNKALTALSLSLEIPSQAMPPLRFERARVLEALGRDKEALQELGLVRDAVPRESSVHFWLGRICKRLDRIDEAVRHFTIAQDLNPKDNAIRAALEQLNDPDAADESAGIM